MVAVYPEHVSRSARWSRRLAVFGAVLFLAAAAAHRFARLDTQSFILALGLVALVFASSIVAFVHAFYRMWNEGDRVGSNLAVAALVLLAGLTPFAVTAYRGFTTPMLNDITTDTESRPVLAVVRDRTPWMNAPRAMRESEAEAQLAAYPQVIGHSYTLPGEKMAQIINGVVAARGWTVLRPFGSVAEGGSATLNAVARSFLVGFPADVAIRIMDDGTATYVDMRSASRYGRHDFGDNAQRIRRFFADLDAAVLADAAKPQVVQ